MNPTEVKPKTLTPAERYALARKAKGDTLAWQAAELLADAQIEQARPLAAEAVAAIGYDDAEFRIRHYAVAKLGVAPGLVRGLLSGLAGEVVA